MAPKAKLVDDVTSRVRAIRVHDRRSSIRERDGCKACNAMCHHLKVPVS